MTGANLSQAEWSVMECLWEESPKTGREITQCMEISNNWSRSTTLTLLKRLEDKGAVGVNSEGKKNSYYPILKHDEAALQQTEDFLHRVYKGSVSLMVSSLTRKQALSKEEIDELYAILKDAEGGN